MIGVDDPYQKTKISSGNMTKTRVNIGISDKHFTMKAISDSGD
jgi:ribosomal protein L18